MVRFSREFCRARKEEVASQYGGGRRPARVQGGHAAPKQGAVNQIIMHQGGGVQKFHRRAEGDEFFEGRIQHVSDEQAEGGADAFASRGKQMLEGGAQVGM